MKAADIVGFSLSENTRRSYDWAWGEWRKLCEANEVEPLSATPQEVAALLVQIAETPRPNVRSEDKKISMSSLEMFVSAVNRKFFEEGIPSPANSSPVKGVMQGLRRMKGGKKRQAMALCDDHIKLMLDTIDMNSGAAGQRRMICYRDASLISMGFSGAMRISEISALRVEDIAVLEVSPKRCVVTIPKSKTDQTGVGQSIPLLDGRHIKPITRLEKWLEVSGITSGYIYRQVANGCSENQHIHPANASRMLKKWARICGMPSEEISGHSLRAGFVTSAAQARAPLHKIMDITRHKHTGTLMQYIRDAEMFSDHAGADFL